MKQRRGAASSTSGIRASVIVPTYKEGANVEPLTKRLFAALPDSGEINTSNVELIFVDDNSRDGSEERVRALAAEGYRVRIIVRTAERGLSSAVMKGFAEAEGDLLLCMDADLQHPPEVVPQLLRSLANPACDFVMGTRYPRNGGAVGIDKDWPWYRRVISEAARSLSRPLTPLSDPMSGFFGITREKYAVGLAGRGNAAINPIGFKIALECYVKCGIKAAALEEVPFMFGVRTAGESKLSGKVILKYVQQLAQLYWYRFPLLVLLLALLVLAAVAWLSQNAAAVTGAAKRLLLK